MDRRAFLGAVCGAVGLPGCTELADRLAESDPSTSGSPPTSRAVASPTSQAAPPPSRAAPPLAEQGYPPDICDRGTVDVGIHAVAEPAFGPDWSAIDVHERYAAGGRLVPDAVVVGVGAGQRGRAYPLSVLWHHEIVNDTVPVESVSLGADDAGAGTDSQPAVPLLVTYCPICQSGVVAERRVAGTPTVFGVSGQLWQPPAARTYASEARNRTFGAAPGNASGELRVRSSANLVMVDEATGSFWSQVLARAICGPRRGDTLRIVPSTLTTWGEWQATHPNTAVLLPPPHSQHRRRNGGLSVSGPGRAAGSRPGQFPRRGT